MTTPTNGADEPLLLFEHATVSGHVVAEARLNSPSTLNALSLPMIDILRPALRRWSSDPAVAAVLLSGNGDRAFSAGGDIQALYRAMVKNHQAGHRVDDYPYRFFEQEYRLDYQIHRFAKPLLSLGHGVVMGGGLGVFSAARYRVVTETLRLAMPEITIGLFPDAGATWLLRSMPSHLATFLALTGAHSNAADALIMGVATHIVADHDRDKVLGGLLEVPWQGSEAADHTALSGYLDTLSAPPQPDAAPAQPAAQVTDVPEDLHCHGSLLDVVEQVRALEGRSTWIDRGIAAMNRGCPTSIGIVAEQLVRARKLELADAFRLEMVVATQCANHRDFAEGIRALIIDKDNQPAWQYGTIEALPEAHVLSHFEAPWPGNPLDDLEEETP
jgi:enoyl-CoA hydratase/carnithine racemase